MSAFSLSVSPVIFASVPPKCVFVGSVRLDELAASVDPIKSPFEFVLKSVAALFGLLCEFGIDDDDDGSVAESNIDDIFFVA